MACASPGLFLLFPVLPCPGFPATSSRPNVSRSSILVTSSWSRKKPARLLRHLPAEKRPRDRAAPASPIDGWFYHGCKDAFLQPLSRTSSTTAYTLKVPMRFWAPFNWTDPGPILHTCLFVLYPQREHLWGTVVWPPLIHFCLLFPGPAVAMRKSATHIFCW